jgi:hypothetical protein
VIRYDPEIKLKIVMIIEAMQHENRTIINNGTVNSISFSIMKLMMPLKIIKAIPTPISFIPLVNISTVSPLIEETRNNVGISSN